MGFFSDIRKLKQQSDEISRNYDPAAQMRAGMLQMQQVQQSMQAATADLDLQRTGTPGAATILSLFDTGTRVNMVPLVRLNLLVEHSGRPPYPATVETLLPLHASAQAGPGQRVSVLADPHQPGRVLVRWGTPA